MGDINLAHEYRLSEGIKKRTSVKGEKKETETVTLWNKIIERIIRGSMSLDGDILFSL